jgi:hypothetical protein
VPEEDKVAAKIPEPPKSVAQENGAHLEIWKEIWSVKVQLASLSTEVRIGLGIMTLILGALIGRYLI